MSKLDKAVAVLVVVAVAYFGGQIVRWAVAPPTRPGPMAMALQDARNRAGPTFWCWVETSQTIEGWEVICRKKGG